MTVCLISKMNFQCSQLTKVKRVLVFSNNISNKNNKMFLFCMQEHDLSFEILFLRADIMQKTDNSLHFWNPNETSRSNIDSFVLIFDGFWNNITFFLIFLRKVLKSFQKDNC